MDEHERMAFDRIVDTDLGEFLEASSDTVDLLDIMAQVLVQRGAIVSMHRSYEYTTPTGKVALIAERYKDEEETIVNVLYDDDEDNVFELRFGKHNELNFFGIDDEHASDAKEVMDHFALYADLTEAERMMATHLSVLIATCDPEHVAPDVYVSHNDTFLHVADMVKATVGRIATYERAKVGYIFSFDEHKLLWIGHTSVIDTDDEHKDVTGESLEVRYTDAVLSTKYTYRRDDEGDAQLVVEPIGGYDQTYSSLIAVNGLTNKNVDFMVDLLLPRVFELDSEVQG